ncbi:carboxymuconolactone decarboxylase family protein [Pectobacterium carotovorum]|uniref:carboxymuconolactone decarboxylase family protein n=1 Tax=Pectobacterium carotovorum TaxID=554 RepID=UPI0035A21C58
MMRFITLTLLGIISATPSFAQDNNDKIKNATASQSSTVSAVSPALEHYMQAVIQNDLWKRPQLSLRDRSLVTLAVMVSRNQTSELSAELNRALDNGVKPSEISELITHLAFYSGLGNATGASGITKSVFEERGISPDQLPAATPVLLPIDRQQEAKRAEIAEKSAGGVSPGLVKFTTKVLFQSLWLRPDLIPRDRSLITVTSLISNGQVGQIGFHLNKAMDNGLSREQVGEVITQIAFYAGWPNAFSAVPVVDEVINKRAR